MARVWGTVVRCKHCGRKIERNTARKRWEDAASGSEVCRGSDDKVHEPRG